MGRALALLFLASALGCARAAAPASDGSAPPTTDPVVAEGSSAAATATTAPSEATASPPATPSPAPPAPGAQAAPVDPASLPAVALTPEQLQALHPVGTFAHECVADDFCQPPLRCLAGRCGWPAAMSGLRDDETVIGTFATASGPVTFFLEAANTNAERARGLMFRRNMAPDAGMVFVFPQERPQSFWMRNTLIPLDMVFVRSDLTVDSVVADAEPLTETPRSSSGPALYVVELNAGFAARHGIEPGVRVSFDNLPAPQ